MSRYIPFPVNPKSGGQVGEEVLSDFRGYLNPIQVVILGRSGLRSMLRWIPSSARILVAGGDGSVSAVLTTITDAGINVRKNICTKLRVF